MKREEMAREIGQKMSKALEDDIMRALLGVGLFGDGHREIIYKSEECDKWPDRFLSFPEKEMDIEFDLCSLQPRNRWKNTGRFFHVAMLGEQILWIDVREAYEDGKREGGEKW